MARKGRKTRWRKLPIPIGNGQQQSSQQGGGAVGHVEEDTEPEDSSVQSQKDHTSRVTFNEDEYTKITTPRQDMLFKKGYLGRKKPQVQETYLHPEPLPPQSPSESVEGEQYMGCEEGMPLAAPYVYPSGYIDQNGVFYVNSGSYEVYDPYTGNLTVIVGPGAGYPGQPVLAAMPCHPVPLQPVEWFNPQQPQWNQPSLKKRNSTDSQNWGSSQSCESPTSPPEPTENQETPLFYPQYVYPGYMFGAPLYNVNGVSVQGAPQPQAAPPIQQADPPKRRKKRRKKRRQGVGDEGSESSCEEQGGSGGSGGSSDVGQGSSCSKTTDSGVHTANSGADSPQPAPQPLDSSSDSADSQPPSPVTVPAEVLAMRVSSADSLGKPIEEGALAPSVDEVKDDESDEGVSEASTFAENKPCDERWTSVEEPLDNVEERFNVPEINETSEELINDQPLVENNSPDLSKDYEEEEETSTETIHPNSLEELSSSLQEVEINIKMPESIEQWSTADESVQESQLPITEVIPEEEKDCYLSKNESTLSKEPPVKQESEDHWNNAEDINLPLEVEERLASKEECTQLETEVRWQNEGVNLLTEPEEIWGSAEDTNPMTDLEDRWQFAETDIGVDALGEVKPITEAVTRWLETQGTLVVAQLPEESEDEGIGDDASTTGQKNAHGNPFLAPYHSSGTRTRVASTVEEETSSDNWSVWAAKCDPATSVDRYYRLAAESPPQLKTATMHIHPTTPFPCGLVCCILQ